MIESFYQPHSIENITQAVVQEKVKAVQIFEAVQDVAAETEEKLRCQTENTANRLNLNNDKLEELKSNALIYQQEIKKLTEQFAIFNEILEELRI